MIMPRPVSVSSAYELLLAKQEERDARPEYVFRSAELVPAQGGCDEQSGSITEDPQARREHDLRDDVEAWDGVD